MQSNVICWTLLTLFIGVVADKKKVEQGSLVLLFENVTADNVEKDVSLFVNGVRNASLIATFKYVNGYILMHWKVDNYKKIFMDATRNIWIANMDETYERKFYIQSSKNFKHEVELTISKTNYSTTVRTALNENTQKGDAFPETSYSTTERTPQKETTQKGDTLPDRRSSDTDYVIACIVLLVFLILMVIILIVVIMKKDHRFSWILCKKSNSVPQPVQFIFHHDSPDSLSYQLMWYKPDDGGSPLIKYIIRYCEVEINRNGTEYELSKPLSQLVTVEISPSDISYTLSPLKPGSYYQVEVQAVNIIGMSSERFIFKTKESAQKQAVKEVARDFPFGVEQAHPTSLRVTDENILKVQRPSKTTVPISPRNDVTDSNDTLPSTSSDEQNSNRKSPSTARKQESLDSDADSNDEQDALLPERVLTKISDQ